MFAVVHLAHKVHIYIPLSPRPNWDSPIPSPASECVPPRTEGGVSERRPWLTKNYTIFNRLSPSLKNLSELRKVSDIKQKYVKVLDDLKISAVCCFVPEMCLYTVPVLY